MTSTTTAEAVSQAKILKSMKVFELANRKRQLSETVQEMKDAVAGKQRELRAVAEELSVLTADS